MHGTAVAKKRAAQMDIADKVRVLVQAAPKPMAYSVPAAALVSGIGRSSLYELMRDGTLPSVRVAGRRLILESDLRALLEGARTDSTAQA